MNSSNEENSCGICFEKAKLGNITCCLNLICESCVKKWPHSCPFCRDSTNNRFLEIESSISNKPLTGVTKKKKKTKRTVSLKGSRKDPIHISDDETSEELETMSKFVTNFNFLIPSDSSIVINPQPVKTEPNDLEKAIKASLEEEKKEKQKFEEEAKELEFAIRLSKLEY